MMERRDFLKNMAVAAICAPYVCRNSGLLMPIADRSLVTYEVRGEQLAPGGGPLPEPDWLQTMRFRVPRRSVNSQTWLNVYAAAKKARPEVYWTNVVHCLS